MYRMLMPSVSLDHTFIFLIVRNEPRIDLFIGRVLDPSAS